MKRLVLLGASNARRGLPAAVASARAGWGRDVQIFGAVGHGRSYGTTSSVLGRELPGILECGIWRNLEAEGRVDSACLADIGNDILYGASVPRILDWVAECVGRLEALGADVSLMGLPIENLERLGPGLYLLFRSILFPSSRIAFEELLPRARELDRGLARLAEARGARFLAPRSRWYGFDPIHIRFRDSASAWAEILGTGTAPRLPSASSLRVRLAQPERRRLLTVELHRSQPAIVLEGGTELRLF